MKMRLFRVIALICVISVLFSAPTFAAEQASYQLTSYNAAATHIGDGEIAIEFDVLATGIMAKVGASDIYVYENVLGNWVLYWAFDENDPDMLSEDDYYHVGTVSFPAYENGYFKVVTYIYAEDYNGGSDTRALVDYVYT